MEGHSSGSYHCEKCSPKHFSHLFECLPTFRGAMLFNFLSLSYHGKHGISRFIFPFLLFYLYMYHQPLSFLSDYIITPGVWFVCRGIHQKSIPLEISMAHFYFYIVLSCIGVDLYLPLFYCQSLGTSCV